MLKWVVRAAPLFNPDRRRRQIMDVAIRDISKLLPLAIVLAIVAVAVTWMLQRDMALGTWVFAAFLFGHGLVHIMFAAPPPAEPGSPAQSFAFDPARSWLVTSGALSVATLKIVVVGLVAAVVVGYTLTALATVGLIVPTAWWSALLIVSTGLSVALMVIALIPGLALGVAIDLVLIWVALTAAWSPSGVTAV